jgi:hypothetical protein
LLCLTMLLGTALSPTVASAAATPNSPCDRVAWPGVGAAQRLVDSLSAGQTGCLHGGTYAQSGLRFGRGGTTVTSFPGERARLTGGYVYVPQGSDHVTVSHLDIDDPVGSQVTVQIMAANTLLERLDITNRRRHSCVIVGSNAGAGAAAFTVIRESRIHDCGDPAHGNQDHAIYVENSAGARITDNLFWNASGWAVHLYPNARRTTVAHNVIDGNGRGVIFAGDSTLASSHNVVSQNLITNSTVEYNLQSWWGGPVGTGNVARSNCLYNGRLGNIASPRTGFTAVANKIADPSYVDRQQHDYRMRAGSPCLAVVGYDTAASLEPWAGT